MFRCIIATNSPFTFSGNKQFKRLVEMLRPGTTVPNRNKISDEIVDKIYNEEKLKVAAVVNGLSATKVSYSTQLILRENRTLPSTW